MRKARRDGWWWSMMTTAAGWMFCGWSGGVCRAATAIGDFNGDGIADLAVGIPGEALDAGGETDAGAVQVFYGSARAGLTAAGNQLWHQSLLGLASEEGDEFGYALAAGDFNGDNYADLVVGVPFEDVGAVDQGAVVVIYGSTSGLVGPGQFWTQDSTNIEGGGEAGDHFGKSLAAGDFNGDGRHDLAVGVPDEDTAAADAGAVNIIYGSASGLTSSGDQVWTQDDLVGSASEAGDQFGYALVSANFGRSTHADLAIGNPYEDWVSVVDAGSVTVVYGSATGLTATGNTNWTQDNTDVEGVIEAGDAFGFSLAAGNFGNSSHADLAIGVAHEEVDGAIQAGAVNVLYGGTNGISAAGDQIWHQNSANVYGTAEFFDHFGWSLAVGNFNGTSIGSYADLAIGTYGENEAAGGVTVLYGSSTGLTGTGSQYWDQNSTGVLGTAGPNEAFGYSLAAGNFGKTTHWDLAIGAPWDAEGNIFDAAGAVNVLYGSSSKLTATGDQLWHQDSTNVLGSRYYFESFGHAAASK